MTAAAPMALYWCEAEGRYEVTPGCCQHPKTAYKLPSTEPGPDVFGCARCVDIFFRAHSDEAPQA